MHAPSQPVYDTTKNCWVDESKAVYTCQVHYELFSRLSLYEHIISSRSRIVNWNKHSRIYLLIRRILLHIQHRVDAPNWHWRVMSYRAWLSNTCKPTCSRSAPAPRFSHSSRSVVNYSFTLNGLVNQKPMQQPTELSVSNVSNQPITWFPPVMLVGSGNRWLRGALPCTVQLLRLRQKEQE